jgi:Tfp pilus assembly protein PilN
VARSWNLAKRPFLDDRPGWLAAAVLGLAGVALLVANVRLYAEYRRESADTRAAVAALEARGERADRAVGAARAALASYQLSTLAEESRVLSRLIAERRFSWNALLGRLERTLPSDVGLLRLQPRFDEQGGVWLELQFLTRNPEAASKTIAALARDPAFAEIELRSESTPEATKGEPFQFMLQSRYFPEGHP